MEKVNGEQLKKIMEELEELKKEAKELKEYINRERTRTNAELYRIKRGV
jgi:hypothetical protein